MNRTPHTDPTNRRTLRSARGATVLVAGFATLSLAGCGGGGIQHAIGVAAGTDDSPTAANTLQFCRDYSAATHAYTDTGGDTTDPQFSRFISLLGKSRDEAPAAVKPSVSKMYDTVVSIARHGGEGDVSGYSTTIMRWTAIHCPSGGSSGWGYGGSRDDGGSSGDDGPTD